MVPGPYADWLVALGLARIGESNESYVMFDAGDGVHGYVGLHYVYTDTAADLPIVAGRGSVHLTFATHEPLDAVAARLVEAGYGDAQVIVEDFGSLLSVTDPDGQEVQCTRRRHPEGHRRQPRHRRDGGPLRPAGDPFSPA